MANPLHVKYTGVMAKAGEISGKHRAAAKGRIKNPVASLDEHRHPFPQMQPVGSLPGVTAILERARTPYKRQPLTEDEALNLICDARSHEPDRKSVV